MPDTLEYMIMGYVTGLGIFALTVGSLFWRYRNIKADEAALAKLEAEAAKDGGQIKVKNVSREETPATMTEKTA